MIFPEFINEKDVIGVTALSNGCSKDTDIIRFENGKKQLEDLGYKVSFTDNVFTADEKGRSSSGRQRAMEFNNLIKDGNVKAIVSAKGGDYLCEMLEHVDFEAIRNNPKWIQGYSDNTGILFPISTKYDIATIYGNNFGDFGMKPWQACVKNALGVLKGETLIQNSFETFENDFHDYITGFEGYSADEKVCWKNARGEEKIEIKGRMIGGCLDVLLNLVGTKYEDALGFCERYKDDGIIWYLESFALGSEALMMGLWQLKTIGWFEHAKGIVFGRPMFYESFSETSYEEAVMTRLGDLNIPIILDADIGHKGPQFSIINGAIATIRSVGGKGSLEYHF